MRARSIIRVLRGLAGAVGGPGRAGLAQAAAPWAAGAALEPAAASASLQAALRQQRGLAGSAAAAAAGDDGSREAADAAAWAEVSELSSRATDLAEQGDQEAAKQLLMDGTWQAWAPLGGGGGGSRPALASSPPPLPAPPPTAALQRCRAWWSDTARPTPWWASFKTSWPCGSLPTVCGVPAPPSAAATCDRLPVLRCRSHCRRRWQRAPRPLPHMRCPWPNPAADYEGAVKAARAAQEVWVAEQGPDSAAAKFHSIRLVRGWAGCCCCCCCCSQPCCLDCCCCGEEEEGAAGRTQPRGAPPPANVSRAARAAAAPGRRAWR